MKNRHFKNVQIQKNFQIIYYKICTPEIYGVIFIIYLLFLDFIKDNKRNK